MNKPDGLPVTSSHMFIYTAGLGESDVLRDTF